MNRNCLRVCSVCILALAFACDGKSGGTEYETGDIACRDGRDNDGDGQTDCADPGCRHHDFCQCINDGDPCDDGSYCNGTDTCAGGSCSVHSGDPCTPYVCDDVNDTCTTECGGCFIEDHCYADRDVSLTNVCLFCDTAVSDAAWTDNDGASCDDGEFCNGPDTCDAGLCALHGGDPCTGTDVCLESRDSCVPPVPEINVTNGITDIPSGSGSFTFQPTPDGLSLATFTIENLGGADLTLTSIAVTGADAADFSVDTSLTSFTVGVESITTFEVAFSPLSSGSKTAQVNIASDDADENPYVFDLDGQGSSNAFVQIVPTATPGGRFSHRMTTLDTGNVLLFGGRVGYVTFHDDTWEFDMSTQTWAQVATTGTPGPLHTHAMVHVGGGLVVLYGGHPGRHPTPASGDTWEYDRASQTWTLLSPTGVPGQRFQHDMVYVGNDTIIMFGGMHREANGDKTGHNDTWEYNVTTRTWTQVFPASSPSVRWAHRMTYLGNGEVLLFGGHDTNLHQSFDDTWIYNVAGQTWTPITTSTAPSERHNHALVTVDTGTALLFFGWDKHSSNTAESDIWEYDPTADDWLELSPSGLPPARYSHWAAATGGRTVIIFGGRFLNEFGDTWGYVR